MAITLSKAIEILDLNVKEAHKTMPGDVKRLSAWLSTA